MDSSLLAKRAVREAHVGALTFACLLLLLVESTFQEAPNLV
jgi:hypothetical protein